MPLPAQHVPVADQADHAALVVSFDAGDLAGAERERAVVLLASCPGCSELAADLAAIRLATAALPAPRRMRDFRLTDADAARLSPTRWRRFLGWLAAPGSAVRPLAGGLAAIGVAGLLLTTVPGILQPGSLAAPAYAPAPAPDKALGAAPSDAIRTGGGAAPTAAPAMEATAAPVSAPSAAPLPQPTAAATAVNLSPDASPEATAAPNVGAQGPTTVCSTGPHPAGASQGVSTDNSNNTGGECVPGTDNPAAMYGTGNGSGQPGAGAAGPGGTRDTSTGSTTEAAPLRSSDVSPGPPDRTIPIALSLALLAAGLGLLAGRRYARRALGR